MNLNTDKCFLQSGHEQIMFQGHEFKGQGHRDIFCRRHNDRRFAVEDDLVFPEFQSATKLADKNCGKKDRCWPLLSAKTAGHSNLCNAEASSKISTFITE